MSDDQLVENVADSVSNRGTSVRLAVLLELLPIVAVPAMFVPTSGAADAFPVWIGLFVSGAGWMEAGRRRIGCGLMLLRALLLIPLTLLAASALFAPLYSEEAAPFNPVVSFGLIVLFLLVLFVVPAISAGILVLVLRRQRSANPSPP